MKTNIPDITIAADDILNSTEKAVVVPCSTRAGYKGCGVDAAIYGKYPLVEKKWSEWVNTAKRDERRTMDFGEVCTIGEYGRVFILVAVPPMSKKQFYYGCNLENCYLNAIKAACECGCKSIALPLLGTGSLGWEISESFYSLYSTVNELAFRHYDFYLPPDIAIALYLKDPKAVEHAQKNNWDICMCFDLKPIDDRITFMRQSGYEYCESTYLQDWLADKEKYKKDRGITEPAESGTSFLLSVEVINQSNAINANRKRKLREIDLAERSGLSRNTVSCIFTGNPSKRIDKETLIALGYAMGCSRALICKWLRIIGMCFNDSERDRAIEGAFKKGGRPRNVAALNDMLLSSGFEPLMTTETADERREFARRLDEKINAFSLLSGRRLTDREIAEKSGMHKNAIFNIRKAREEFKPEKDKIIALAAALRCSTDELSGWLKLFGMALSDNKRDNMILKAFNERTVRDAHELNRLLLQSRCSCLKVTAFKRSPERDDI